MSKFLKSLSLAAVATMLSLPAVAQPLGLGRAALPEEISAWNLDIHPDGTGLPDGEGDVLDGEEIFATKCAACHGDFAEGIDNWPKLAGGKGTLNREDPVKTVGSYWPYLSTTFDYIRRSMPYGNAGTLTNDEVYAIVAYILYSNDLVEDDFVLSKDNFLDVKMPNADGFIQDNRMEVEIPQWTGEPCMTDCKDKVEVTMRALVLDVTPETADGATETKASATTEPKEEAAAEQPAATPEPAPAQEQEAEIAAVDPALIEDGEKVFRKCKACHQVGDGAKNRSGPVLNGVVGATVGHIEDFKYSKAFKEKNDEGMVWNDETLAAFLAGPKAYIKGTKMGFGGLKKESDIEAVIAYLSTFSQQ
ncbi:c-type cytochrome [Sulfitobacter sp.]|jgi:S-disulfanyl-L-cysteine oxidoreductase SoxD|uniref:c-type cytochrome n=1 Tax=Sulfitobacter sp. TaxID=1903071 RepID=UPI000C10B26E|nr:MFS transporter [Roseobacter sp.]MBV47834.1 MFS transporter [Roseobacter sp.]PHR09651.1 MAG: MFS transporter [Sulfitobacter sp.]|tara:strand:+ start:3740 stop:4825 length:1086 start_codon:yes stop_codon:yes gene_type:complete